MTKREYNGWFNYETWLVSLWIDNDEGAQSHWLERASEVDDAHDLAREMESHWEENMPECDGFWADLLTSALGEVNWHEVAEHLISDAKEHAEHDAKEANDLA